MIDKDLIIQLQQKQISQLNVMVANFGQLDAEQNAMIDNLKQLGAAQNVAIDNLNALNAEQAKLIELLKAHVAELQNNQKKNSGNSSKPPSSDIGKPKRTQSLRSSSDKKPGGQSGHAGETLTFSATPDVVIKHDVSVCTCCGKNLKNTVADAVERRQVYDIPPITMMVTEHQGEVKNCPRCYTVNRAVFPNEVSQPVQYGARVQTQAAYFIQHQLLPYARTAQLFGDLFGHAPSQAFLVNNNRRLADQLLPFWEELRTILHRQPVLHADETGCYYNGQRYWLHTLCNEKYTLYMPHAKRGVQAMDEMGVLTNFTGTLVHDFWKPYNEYTCNHALCNVHHLRDLTFCEEVLECSWAKEARKYLLDLYKKVQQARQTGQEGLTPAQRQYWNKKFIALLQKGKKLYPSPKKIKGRRGVTAKTKSHNLLERFEKYKSEVLAFEMNFTIPFGNNLAEQAIRMMKVKQKISGCFRSEQGAKDFATIRSYTATMQKHGVSIIHAIQEAINGTPRLPWA